MNPEAQVVVRDATGDDVDRDFSWVAFTDETGREWVTRTFGLEPGDQVFFDGALSWTEPE